MFAFADYLLTERGDKETLWIGSSKEFSHSLLFFFYRNLSRLIFVVVVSVCVSINLFFLLVNKNLDQHSAIVWLENPAKV